MSQPRESVVDLVVGGQHGGPPDDLGGRRLHPAVQRLAPLAEQLLQDFPCEKNLTLSKLGT